MMSVISGHGCIELPSFSGKQASSFSDDVKPVIKC